MDAVIVENISCSYGDIKAVDGISFRIPEGQILGFLGPNGAGKTTTLKMLIGLLKPQSGRIIILGMDAAKEVEKYQARIGVCFEEKNLYEDMSAQENLRFFASLYGIKRPDVDGLLERVGLAANRRDRVSNFSKGMKQRLMIARALVNRPDVLFLDEPTDGLDPVSAEIIRDVILEEKNRGVAQALRQVSPPDIDVNFKQIRIGTEEPLDLFELFFPLVVLIVIMIGAYMIPAAFIVQEKERQTLSALLVTPASVADIFVAYSLSGILVSLFMALVMLALIVGLGQQLLVVVAILLASLMSAELGLMMGMKARDMNTLIALMKSLNIFFIGPAILDMFPAVPDWVIKIFPTYYLFDPIVQITLYGKGFSDIAWEFGLLVVFIVVLLIPLFLMARDARFAAQ